MYYLAVLGLTVALQGTVFPAYNGWQREFKPWVLAWLGISAVTDIALATVLVFFLVSWRVQRGWFGFYADGRYAAQTEDRAGSS